MVVPPMQLHVVGVQVPAAEAEVQRVLVEGGKELALEEVEVTNARIRMIIGLGFVPNKCWRICVDGALYKAVRVVGKHVHFVSNVEALWNVYLQFSQRSLRSFHQTVKKHEAWLHRTSLVV